MGRGLSRAFVGMATSLVMSIAQQNGVPLSKAFDQPKKRNSGIRGRSARCGHTGKMHGGKERARRFRQMNTGKMTFGEVAGYGGGGDRSQYDDRPWQTWWRPWQTCGCGLPRAHWKGKF